MQFYLHGSSIFVIFYFFVFFVFLEGTLKIAVLPAWELNSGEVDLQFCVFLWFLKMLKKQVFANLAFSRFFIIFGASWEACWLSFGVLLESPASLWRAGVILLALFGLPEPSVGSLCYFLWCLWLSVGSFFYFWANLGAIFGCSFHVLPLLGEFRWCWGCGLKVWKCSFDAFSFVEISNALPVPMLRQVFK